MIRAILKGLHLVERIMKWIAAAALMSMALITGADVASSSMFNTPIFGAEELVAILAVLVTGFAMPYSHRQGAHIGVEVFMEKLPKTVRNVMSLITNSVAAVLFGILTWQMVLYGLSMRTAATVTMNLEMPIYFFIFALALAFAAFTLSIAGDVLTLFAKDEN